MKLNLTSISLAAALLVTSGVSLASGPEWQGQIQNSENVGMTCQAIDYSHFHTYGGCAPCAGVDGKVGAHQTLQLTVGGKQCPKKSRAGETCPVTNINDIGVDCYETDGGSGYVLKQKIPTKTKLIWTFGEFNQIS